MYERLCISIIRMVVNKSAVSFIYSRDIDAFLAAIEDSYFVLGKIHKGFIDARLGDGFVSYMQEAEAVGGGTGFVIRMILLFFQFLKDESFYSEPFLASLIYLADTDDVPGLRDCISRQCSVVMAVQP